MKTRLYTYSLILLIAFSIACERNIKVNIPDGVHKIVIEGVIEQGEPPFVFVSRNAGYFDEVDQNSLMEMIVQDAEVRVSDGEKIVNLNIEFYPYYFPFYRFTTNEMLGEAGKTYSLEVKVDNETYTSKTTIPPPVAIDSIVFKVQQGFDSLGIIWNYFTDPDTLGNRYRFYSKTLGLDSAFVSQGSTLIDDKDLNGINISYPMLRGYGSIETTSEIDGTSGASDNSGREYGFLYYIGDTVVVKMNTLDKEHYHFWENFYIQQENANNPFASPSELITNIEGGAMGVWGGYGAAYDTIIIKHHEQNNRE